jgi:hypothetical protein
VSKTFEQALKEVVASIQRGKGRFAVARLTEAQRVTAGTAQPFSLIVGHNRTVGTPFGPVVTLGMTREHLEELRDACIELLEGSTS